MPRTDVRCPKANCGGTVKAIIGTFGRVAYVCARCERKKAQHCRDCPARTPSTHHWRCVPCAKQHRRELGRVLDRLRNEKRKPAVAAQWKRRMQEPDFRQHRADYMAAYRRKHGQDHFARVYNREYMRVRRASPAYRRKENQRKRAARALKAAA